MARFNGGGDCGGDDGGARGVFFFGGGVYSDVYMFFGVGAFFLVPFFCFFGFFGFFSAFATTYQGTRCSWAP